MARMPHQNMTPGRPAKPPGLTKAAGEAWDRLVADLTESNIQIAKAHGRLLEMAVSIVVDMADSRETLETEGAYVENEKTGVVQMHPAARRLDNLRRDYVKVLSLLGLRSAVGGTLSTGKTLDEELDEE